MSVFTSFAGQISTDPTGSSVPTVTVVSMPLASTEYSVSIPVNCRQFLVKLRSTASLQITYTAGQSATSYITVPRNCFYAESDLKIAGAVTLYFQSPAASQELEVLTWV